MGLPSPRPGRRAPAAPRRKASGALKSAACCAFAFVDIIAYRKLTPTSVVRIANCARRSFSRINVGAQIEARDAGGLLDSQDARGRGPAPLANRLMADSDSAGQGADAPRAAERLGEGFLWSYLRHFALGNQYCRPFRQDILPAVRGANLARLMPSSAVAAAPK